MFAEIEVPQKLIKDAAKQADVAIITIHRNSGEGSDRSSEKGDFYLTDHLSLYLLGWTFMRINSLFPS